MNCIASNFMYVTVNIFSTVLNILKVYSTSMLILLTYYGYYIGLYIYL